MNQFSYYLDQMKKETVLLLLSLDSQQKKM